MAARYRLETLDAGATVLGCARCAALVHHDPELADWREHELEHTTSDAHLANLEARLARLEAAR